MHLPAPCHMTVFIMKTVRAEARIYLNNVVEWPLSGDL
jgi:hypothetical protein